MRNILRQIAAVIMMGATWLCGCTERSSESAATQKVGGTVGGSSASTPASQPGQAALVRRDSLIPAGEPAPDFTTTGHGGQSIHLAQLLEKEAVVLVFYPADFTPGCTKQLCSVRDDWAEFQKRGATVLGVNPADVAKHASFAQQYKFPFPIAFDEGGQIAAAYGCKGGQFTQRTVYVIGKDGKVKLGESGMVKHEKIFAALDGK